MSRNGTRGRTLKELLDLSPDGQECLLKRLTHHALRKMRRLTWRGAYASRGGAVPGAYEAHDFALDAVSKALDGSRRWNREVHQTLEAFLRSIIDSDINHLVESVDNRIGRRLAPASGTGETLRAYELAGTGPGPASIVIDEEWRDRFHKAARKELGDDEFLLQLLECMEADITAPRDIAELLGTTVERVNNDKKRLRRKLQKLDTRVKPGKARIRR